MTEQHEYVDLPADQHYFSEHGVVTRFKRTWSGHRFTDAEVAQLLAGETIEITAISAKTKNKFTVRGSLQGQAFTTDEGETKAFVSFKPDFGAVDPKTHAVGEWVGRPGRQTKFKRTYKPDGGHDFSDSEVAQLLAGNPISFTTADGRAVTGKLSELSFEKNGETISYVGFEALTGSSHATGEWVGRPGQQTRFKRSFGGYDFTDEDVAALLAGEMIGFEATSAKGDAYEANGRLEEATFTSDSGETVNYVGFKPQFDD